MKPTLSIAANGHAFLNFGDYYSESYRQACVKLENELEFLRHGKTIVGLDEGISPSFCRAAIEIATGWDIWSGDYLLANSDAGDEILRHLYAELS